MTLVCLVVVKLFLCILQAEAFEPFCHRHCHQIAGEYGQLLPPPTPAPCLVLHRAKRRSYFAVGGGTSAPSPNRGIARSLAIRSFDWNCPCKDGKKLMGCGWRATRPIPRTGRWLADCAICATNPSPRRPFTRPWLVLIGTPVRVFSHLCSFFLAIFFMWEMDVKYYFKFTRE